MAVSEKGFALTGLLGRGRGRGGASPLVKTEVNAATPVVVDDLLFSPNAGGAYTLTCQGGSYSITGSSAVINYTSVKPILISTTNWRAADLPAADTGPLAITVPPDAQAVVVMIAATGAVEAMTVSMSSNFSSAFTVLNFTQRNGAALGYATVNSTGSKTISFVLSEWASEGPSICISFIKGINTSDWVRDAAVVGSVGTDAFYPSTSISSGTSDLLLVLNEQDGSTIPTTMAGYTSLTTNSGSTSSARLESCDSPSSGTNTVTSTAYSDVHGTLAVISIKPGTSGATNYTLTCLGGTYTVTGQQAILKRSKVVVASGGSYAVTGQSAIVKKSRVIVSQGGTYNLTGQSANLLKSKKITATGGVYSITGQQAILSRSKYLIAQGGTYSLTGGSVVITWTAGVNNYTLICQGGSYTLLGASAGISRNRNLTANGGSYTYTGSSATIKRNRSLQATGGTYTYTGSSATLLKSKTIQASGGVYTLTGSSAVILKSKVLVGSGGSYVYDGQSATLKRSRVLQASGGIYTITGAYVTIERSISGGYPNPSDVLYGVMYGPTGTEYTGTLDIGKKFRVDIATGNIVMIIDSNKVMSL